MEYPQQAPAALYGISTASTSSFMDVHACLEPILWRSLQRLVASFLFLNLLIIINHHAPFFAIQEIIQGATKKHI